MDSFKIQIAGLVTQVLPLYETTAVYCRSYLTDETAAFCIAITDEDLAFEQHMLDEEAREEGMKLRKFTGPFLERAAIQRKIAEELLKTDTFLLHGSTVAVDGKAYLFTAACGTGKSTHTRLWREVFGERAVMINDDKPFLQITQGGVIAHGSPWSGKHGLDTNTCAPLKGVCILHRGQENQIRPMTAEEALPMLHHQSYESADAASREKVCALVNRLAQRIPLWEMECTKEREAALVAFAAMSKG
jgi:hypothetical protein